MRLLGERRAARARAIVEAFRPLPASRVDLPRVVVTAFGPFPGVPRNATAEIVRAFAASEGIALRSPSFRSPELAVGRGVASLSSGAVHVSILVLPVVWDVAAALVAKEVRATRASLVVLNGVAAPSQPIFVEAVATAARSNARDAFRLRPSRRAAPGRPEPATLDVERARVAMTRAFEVELDAAPALGATVHGVVRRESGGDNAYVCNATAHVTALAARRATTVLRSASVPAGVCLARIGPVQHGFVHWPRDIAPAYVPACARILHAALTALLSQGSRRGETAELGEVGVGGRGRVG